MVTPHSVYFVKTSLSSSQQLHKSAQELTCANKFDVAGDGNVLEKVQKKNVAYQ